jgi:pimeloyl-ACP methyl ester carboxylesterase
MKQMDLRVPKLVLISPSVLVQARFAEFASYLDVSEATQGYFQGRLAREFGGDWWQRISPLANQPGTEVAGLIVHDEGDRIVPLEEARRLNQAWPGSKLCVTHGYGHQRILAQDEVVEAIAQFL